MFLDIFESNGINIRIFFSFMPNYASNSGLMSLFTILYIMLSIKNYILHCSDCVLDIKSQASKLQIISFRSLAFTNWELFGVEIIVSYLIVIFQNWKLKHNLPGLFINHIG